VGRFSWKRRWVKVVVILLVLAGIVFGAISWRFGSVLTQISSSGNIFTSIARQLPGADNQLKGEVEGRINVLLLGMRGADDPSGGNLSDTIIVASVDQKNNRVALMNMPRDLYVDNPVVGYKTKLNAVYAYGESKAGHQGMSNMQKVVGDVTGLPIHYVLTVNYTAFKDVVEALGGLEIHLDRPFVESMQFRGVPQMCKRSTGYTVPTGEVITRTVTTRSGRTDTREYKLCYPDTPSECGGNFQLSAGDVKLDSEQTLCYVRARETSSDFDRARRQMVIIQSIREKASALGTLSDFNKVNGLLSALGNNVTTTMEPWEMKRFFEIYQAMPEPTIYQRVMTTSDNPETGLLYAMRDPNAGEVLLPKGDNYDRIHNLFATIFTLQPQVEDDTVTQKPAETPAKTPAKTTTTPSTSKVTPTPATTTKTTTPTPATTTKSSTPSTTSK
jgi:LCP family protein required for cell wall assembly